MYETLDQVPANIRAFFHEVDHQEFDHYEPETRQDFEGNDYIVQVPVYVTVTEIEKIPQTETKEWSDLDRVIMHGKPDAVIDNFLSMAIYCDGCKYLAAYEKWQQEVADTAEGEVPPLEPAPYVAVSAEQWKLDNYRKLREAAYGGISDIALMQIEDPASFATLVQGVQQRYPAPE